jgi:hypothetical protein
VKPKRVLLPLLAILLLGAATVTTLAAASSHLKSGATPVASKKRPAVAKARKIRLRHANPAVVRRFRSAAWHWQALMGVHRAKSFASLRSRRALRYWRVQARRMRWLAAHPPHKSAWECIHRFEGSWSDSGDPYWGGLQMDRGFMETYAPPALLRKGWADRWTPVEQMWVAERAHRAGRGYSPWPNTARFCGLI